MKIGIYIPVEEGGPTGGHSYKGEISRFLGLPSAGNRLILNLINVVFNVLISVFFVIFKLNLCIRFTCRSFFTLVFKLFDVCVLYFR